MDICLVISKSFIYVFIIHANFNKQLLSMELLPLTVKHIASGGVQAGSVFTVAKPYAG